MEIDPYIKTNRNIKKNGNGYAFKCSESTTQMLGDIRHWLKADSMGQALRCCVERMHRDLQHANKSRKECNR